MIIKCGIGDEELGDMSFSLCHHCGMPVCEKHGWVVASDDAFASVVDPTSNLLVHTAPPARPGQGALQTAISLLRQVKSMTQSVVTVGQPAMHCRDCLDKYHGKGVDKRHGWKETPPSLPGLAGSL